MDIFDTHTHLNSDEFIGREKEIIAQAHELDVHRMNIVGVDRKTNDWAMRLATEFMECYATIGWHPDECGRFDQEAEKYLLENLKKDKVLAVGEIGLDYHWMVESKELQEKTFRRQIQISKEADVPFVVHTRDALEDTYEIIKSEGVGPCGGIMHSFSGGYEEAKKFIELGLMLSFSGVVTFKKTLDVQEAASKLPLDRILVETDAPYLSPMPYRGKENQPGYTRYTAEKIAALRGLTLEEVAEQTYANALKVFGLS
ncbi:TatD family hydrolase [Lactococcus ileimucosae]|uniref:TatD family hydrolase n=1 Tax=Lactococcus ileimucosae TaxID=2941329 RepID=UPI002043B75D|nr:TatD family hydrolase [Lactococcus ileimucosae]